MHADAIEDADRNEEGKWAANDAIEGERETLKLSMLALMMRGNVNAPADFAPLTRRIVPQATQRDRSILCRPRLHETMSEALEYGDGPEPREVMALLLQVAAGKNQQNAALALVHKMADAYAKHWSQP